MDFIHMRYCFNAYKEELGLPVPDKFEDLLMNTPEAKVVINEPEPYPEWILC